MGVLNHNSNLTGLLVLDSVYTYEGEKRMTEIILYDGTKWYLQKITKKNLDILLQNVKTAELDLVIVIDGHEGWGKSFGARGIGRYCATKLGTTFGVDDIYFSIETYMEASLAAGSAKRTGVHKINVLDEGRHALNRKRSMSKKGVLFTNYLSECRGLGQVHIILAPAYHDLDRYLIMWRMQLLIHFEKNHIVNEDNDSGFQAKRGQYFLYTYKKGLNICYYKQYDYPRKYEERNWWSNKEVFSESELKAYDDKKEAATVEKYAEKPVEEKPKYEEPGADEGFVKIKALVDVTGVSRNVIIQKIQSKEIRGYKFGGVWLVHKSAVREAREMGNLESSNSSDSVTRVLINTEIKDSKNISKVLENPITKDDEQSSEVLER